MAAPGFGDVVTMIQIVYSVYQKCKDTPGAVNEAMDDILQMRVELESMQEKVNNPASFIYKNKGKMLSRMKETFEPIIEGLQRMKQLLDEYRRIPPWSGLKLKYAYVEVPIIRDIQASFLKYRSIYSSAFQHIGAEADAHNAAQLDEITARNAQLEKDLDALKKQQTNAAKLQKDANGKMDQLLKGLAAMRQPVSPSSEPNQKMETQLRAAGLKEEEVKRIMAALKFDSIPPINVMPDPNTGPTGKSKTTSKKSPLIDSGGLKIPSRPRSNSQPRNSSAKISNQNPEAGKKRVPSPSPTRVKSPSLKLSPKVSPAPQKPKQAHEIRILCIDSTNGFRSTQAQAYLSLIRLWTANTSSPPGSTWLFETVSSAGLNVSGPINAQDSNNVPVYTAAEASVRETALKALCGAPSYFWSDNYPFEKEQIMTRVKMQEARGLQESDFKTYDYMLCFGAEAYASLVSLAVEIKSAKGKDFNARVVLIPGTEWFDSRKHKHAMEIAEVTGDLKKGLKEWAVKELGWIRPDANRGIVSSIEGVQGRTVQLVVNMRTRRRLVEKQKDDANALGIKEVEGCIIHWEAVAGSRELLLSITGAREKLQDAETWIRALH